MRQSAAELERSSGKKGAVPITVRQLEAVIRIAGKFADRWTPPQRVGWPCPNLLIQNLWQKWDLLHLQQDVILMRLFDYSKDQQWLPLRSWGPQNISQLIDRSPCLVVFLHQLGPSLSVVLTPNKTLVCRNLLGKKTDKFSLRFPFLGKKTDFFTGRANSLKRKPNCPFPCFDSKRVFLHFIFMLHPNKSSQEDL